MSQAYCFIRIGGLQMQVMGWQIPKQEISGGFLCKRVRPLY